MGNSHGGDYTIMGLKAGSTPRAYDRSKERGTASEKTKIVLTVTSFYRPRKSLDPSRVPHVYADLRLGFWIKKVQVSL